MPKISAPKKWLFTPPLSGEKEREMRKEGGEHNKGRLISAALFLCFIQKKMEAERLQRQSSDDY